MTEVQHGSNVSALQTEAVLDIDTDEWVINTPDDGAIKWWALWKAFSSWKCAWATANRDMLCRWIGNAAEDGIMATVFARLKVPAPDGSGALDDQGVHAFIVPLRNPETKQLLPGVEIHDNGYKARTPSMWSQTFVELLTCYQRWQLQLSVAQSHL